MAPPERPSSRSLAAFVGLGSMGGPIAARLVASGAFAEVRVWARTAAKGEAHAAAHGTVAVASLSEVVLTPSDEEGSDGVKQFVFTCLPTSTQVAEIAEALRPSLQRGTVWIDITTGDPEHTRSIAASLAEVGVAFLDAPVSGGPQGAAAGSLTTMVGGEAVVLEDVRFALNAYCARVVHAGAIGAGHTLKAVNNAMAVAHFVVASEGLAALARAGVSPSAALEAINGSSGRSLMTERRFPSEVLTRRFAYGGRGSLRLWAKDARIGAKIVSDGVGELARVIPSAAATISAGAEVMPQEADETELVRLFESAVGVELHGNMHAT